MWLFEVTDTVNTGVKLVLMPGRMGVPLGTDAKYGTPMMLPIGRSISRCLEHPDDQEESFKLKRGRLEEGKLVKQTEEEAAASGKALVFIDRCTDSELGMTRIAEAWGKPSPTLVKVFGTLGYDVELYEFKPGDALFICWPAAALDQRHPKRFIISWDGQQLVEELCRRKPHQRRVRKQQRAFAQEQPSQHEQPVLKRYPVTRRQQQEQLTA